MTKSRFWNGTFQVKDRLYFKHLRGNFPHLSLPTKRDRAECGPIWWRFTIFFCKCLLRQRHNSPQLTLTTCCSLGIKARVNSRLFSVHAYCGATYIYVYSSNLKNLGTTWSSQSGGFQVADHVRGCFTWRNWFYGPKSSETYHGWCWDTAQYTIYLSNSDRGCCGSVTETNTVTVTAMLLQLSPEICGSTIWGFQNPNINLLFQCRCRRNLTHELPKAFGNIPVLSSM